MASANRFTSQSYFEIIGESNIGEQKMKPLTLEQKCAVRDILVEIASVKSEPAILTSCPYCHSKHIVKNGHREDIQSYLCGDCGKSFSKRIFSEKAGKLLWQSHLSLETWELFIGCLMSDYNNRKTCRICGIAENTGAILKKKILKVIDVSGKTHH